MAVTQITQFGFVNAYLVQEDDGLTLIDTAMGGADKKILAAAAATGAPIKRIVLTHAHLDHIGTLDKLVGALDADVEVLISARDARLLAGDKTLDPDEQVGKLRGSFKATTTQPTRTIAPGEMVGSLQVHDAKGHTPGQVALLDTRDQTLYAGDAFATIAGVATSAHLRPQMPLPALATWHRPTQLQTCKALRALEPARLACGHGKVVEAPLEAMDRAIARGD